MTQRQFNHIISEKIRNFWKSRGRDVEKGKVSPYWLSELVMTVPPTLYKRVSGKVE